ncbi:hypothetical protein [Fuchsiella alkaliacetigena]|uniref:hypothetical protein n=1 Tax=Fuchsiella alkaliacetigena TaxID=957042 RepID=UPI00200AA3B0|nr:hypothetical protein [Fuchsiella alkaliacetigena]MCK8823627.1 hypothetical protein [Fuchsiella alkaliacetigena]
MIKIKDKFSFGMLASACANIPINILDYIFYSLDINKHHMWHIAASAYFKKADVKTIPALVTGAISDYSNAGMMGSVILYLLYFTDTEYSGLKGLSVGAAWWLLSFGVILRSKVSRIDPDDAGTNLYHLAEHLLLGFLIAKIIDKYGQEILKDNK